MTIQFCSDLHLEFAENRKLLSRRPLIPSAEILVLAGDIIPFAVMDESRDFMDFVSDHFAMVYWIPGNHEYYGSDISERSGAMCEQIRENVFLVNNHAVRHGNTRLIFSTLWSQINPLHEIDIQHRLSDFSVIRAHGRKFTPPDFSLLHGQSVAFLESVLAQGSAPGNDDERAVVVTHHVPTFLNYPAAYRNSPINEAFATELFDLIESWKADYWIYGHHHVNTPAFLIGKTRMVTNQLGYVRHHEHGSFRRDAVLGEGA